MYTVTDVLCFSRLVGKPILVHMACTSFKPTENVDAFIEVISDLSRVQSTHNME